MLANLSLSSPFGILKLHRPLEMERIMSDLDRLHEIIDTLPSPQVHALLTLLETSQPISEEEVDAETVARILAAEAEPGDTISHSELKQRLGL